MTTEQKYQQLVEQIISGSKRLAEAVNNSCKSDPYIAHWSGKYAAYSELLTMVELMDDAQKDNLPG